MMYEDLIVILPEVFLAISAMAALLYGVFRADNKSISEDNSASFAAVAKLSLLAIFGSILLLISLAQHQLDAAFFNSLFKLDSLAIFAKLAIAVAAFLSLAISLDYCKKFHKNFPYEYSILIVLALVGMMLMISANDFLTLYLGLEIQSLALYVLAAIDRRNKVSSEAGVKYFVLGALASGILLYGVSLIYGFSGTTNFAAFAEVMQGFSSLSRGLIVGLILVIIGLAFKISAAPFHMWAPDVYQGVPTPVTAFFAAVPKIAVAVLLVRVLVGSFSAFMLQWQDIIIIISILSMAVGAFAGIWQRNFKRLMAYSSIANMGYALIGIAAFAQNGISAMLVFLVIYMLGTIAIFAIIMSIEVGKNKPKPLEEIAHLAGLAKTHPAYAALLALMLISLIGLPFPPFAGFFGKFFIFEAATAAGLYGLAIIGVLTSVVAAFYYLRIIKTMYFDEPVEGVELKIAPAKITSLVVAVLILANLLIFVAPHKLLNEMPIVKFEAVKFPLPTTQTRI